MTDDINSKKLPCIATPVNAARRPARCPLRLLRLSDRHVTSTRHLVCNPTVSRNGRPRIRSGIAAQAAYQ